MSYVVCSMSYVVLRIVYCVFGGSVRPFDDAQDRLSSGQVDTVFLTQIPWAQVNSDLGLTWVDSMVILLDAEVFQIPRNVAISSAAFSKALL